MSRNGPTWTCAFQLLALAKKTHSCPRNAAAMMRHSMLTLFMLTVAAPTVGAWFYSSAPEAEAAPSQPAEEEIPLMSPYRCDKTYSGADFERNRRCHEKARNHTHTMLKIEDAAADEACDQDTQDRLKRANDGLFSGYGPKYDKLFEDCRKRKLGDNWGAIEEMKRQLRGDQDERDKEEEKKRKQELSELQLLFAGAIGCAAVSAMLYLVYRDMPAHPYGIRSFILYACMSFFVAFLMLSVSALLKLHQKANPEL